MAESVILELPLAMLLYGAALFFCLFERRYRATRCVFFLLSAALALGASAYAPDWGRRVVGNGGGAAPLPAAESGGGGMNFNSGVFLVFLPAVTAAYWLLPHSWRKYWLLAASYFFYMYDNPDLILLLLLASTAVGYCCGRDIERFQGKRGAMRVFLVVSVCVNLGLLFTFKYFDFFAGTVNSLCAAAGIAYRVPELGLILPVGISFYTFQTMSYTIDVYRGDFPAERDLISLALYVTYFPQLVAGPIESPQSLLPQLKAEHRPAWDDFTAGIRLLLCGFFRKCVAADFCGIYVNAVFPPCNRPIPWPSAAPGRCFASRCTAISPAARRSPPVLRG